MIIYLDSQLPMRSSGLDLIASSVKQISLQQTGFTIHIVSPQYIVGSYSTLFTFSIH